MSIDPRESPHRRRLRIDFYLESCHLSRWSLASKELELEQSDLHTDPDPASAQRPAIGVDGTACEGLNTSLLPSCATFRSVYKSSALICILTLYN